MRFEFASAARIVFGEGAVREVAPAAAAMGRRALVVTGASRERAAPLIAALKAAGVACVSLAVAGEPTVELVRDGARFARAEGCDLVVAMGGGSALDAGKALAALMANTRRSARLPGSGGPRPAAGAHARAVDRCADHRRHGLGGHAQCRAGVARASRKSQPAERRHAAAPGGGGSRIDVGFAAAP